MPTPLADARSFLFVPGDRPERFAKALASGADAVILDLEDAVAPAARAGARAAMRTAWPALAADERARILVRINAAGTAWHGDDAALVAELGAQGLGGMLLAKAEGAEALAALARTAPGVALVPLVETGAGLDALDAIARAPQVLRLALGHIDLQSDLGIACGPGEEEIAPARWDLLRASRRAGLAPPIDGVSTETRDAERIATDAARSLRMGFGGKLCIHPAQVPVVHQVFTPSAEEQAKARRIVEAAEAAGGAVCMLDGKMVDAPVIALARRVLARVR